MVNRIQDNALASIRSHFGKEENECMGWLDTKEPNSVVYVNFGRFLVMPKELLAEFAWGLVNSGKDFLWIVSQDLVATMFPDEFVAKTEGTGMLAGWCDQEQVLSHSAVGGFVMYGEWNWVVESICGGVPVVYWPFYGEQMTNCRYSCVEWGIGMEIDMIAKRNDVEEIIRELIDGEKGKAMREKALEWKDKAHQAAAAPNGSSYLNLDKLLELLLQ